ncbi:unnamed protein product [Protopolystoma xenopodis]|uniref:Uncharacterized protein n=1 Tax=Protopolystoma xenopodis TaxID=117903 RepID=A0A3S4ZU23_9PLAT|nr:unnamed protein product [Protopolystoma xenopodis]
MNVACLSKASLNSAVNAASMSSKAFTLSSERKNIPAISCKSARYQNSNPTNMQKSSRYAKFSSESSRMRSGAAINLPSKDSSISSKQLLLTSSHLSYEVDITALAESAENQDSTERDGHLDEADEEEAAALAEASAAILAAKPLFCERLLFLFDQALIIAEDETKVGQTPVSLDHLISLPYLRSVQSKLSGVAGLLAFSSPGISPLSSPNALSPTTDLGPGYLAGIPTSLADDSPVPQSSQPVQSSNSTSSAGRFFLPLHIVSIRALTKPRKIRDGSHEARYRL